MAGTFQIKDVGAFGSYHFQIRTKDFAMEHYYDYPSLPGTTIVYTPEDDDHGNGHYFLHDTDETATGSYQLRLHSSSTVVEQGVYFYVRRPEGGGSPVAFAYVYHPVSDVLNAGTSSTHKAMSNNDDGGEDDSWFSW